ncbi:class 1a ribonucleoside-diphosphate reductase subunit alpha [Reinekea blandensis]|uniref:Ribonucleoside-diphosphate reductase n=1 Tax=Reinekea blandensis MED297 TaxID=314283 RepID=A4BKB0_9GAMM|nr:class 1a ribonucleoside-diphosphate reductase subunit alpha [Reinekea blandensis]EAR07415.1 ribonucleotide-diphosphate reductase alpha subunit [Reinekea sp. MED297] [Reinekea blandensis MED297]
MNLQIKKRDGRLEPIQLEKIHRVLQWASEGLKKVSVSEVELKARIQFYDGMSTTEIHEMLVRSAADLISDRQPDYQFMAARLAIFHLRKQAFGRFEPPHVYDLVTRLVNERRYDPILLSAYSEADWDELNGCLDHSRDLDFAYAGVKQLQGKYLVQDRVTGRIFESPQFVYLLIGACLFSGYPAETRLTYVKKFYQAASTHRFSLPTPIMAGVRTPTRQFSSCVLIECDDTLDSINATSSSVVNYVSQRAGIGINAGRIRGIGSPIRSGEAFHTGCIPFYKLFQSAVKSCSQGGIRGGAATVFYPLWHIEAEELLVLKNNRGVDENRCRHLDYGVQLNRLMYQRLIQDSHISLFSPSEVPGLYDAFFEDQARFETLYKQYEEDTSIRRRKVNARDLFALLMQERASTGRIYIQNVDHCNEHGPFDPAKAPIRQSNLCMEIALPTKPLQSLDDEQGEIALCTLAAVNLGVLDSLDDIDETAELLVRALDALLDYQHYPVKAAELSTHKRRPLGVGVINYAYYLAKHGYRYDDEGAKGLTHRTFERLQFALLSASNRLAREQGACSGFAETKLAKGSMPIDRYKADLDAVCQEPLLCDWAALRESILEHGVRNSTLSALMPSETSAQIANATNGIEPPRALVSIKASKDGVLKQVVPEIERLADQYDLLWDQQSNAGYLALAAIMQKFVDQAISSNTSYQPERYPDRKVPMQTLLGDLLTAYKLGLKTLYYHNTRDGSAANHNQKETIAESCESGACAI